MLIMYVSIYILYIHLKFALGSQGIALHTVTMVGEVHKLKLWNEEEGYESV